MRFMRGWAVVLGLALAGCSTVNPPGHPAAARQYYADYLQQCGKGEIRCLWFLQDDPRLGMELTLDLDTHKTEAVRDPFQGQREEMSHFELDDLEVSEINRLLSHLPAAEASAPYGSTIFLARRVEGAIRVWQYNRHYPPGEVRALFNLTNTYFYSDDHE